MGHDRALTSPRWRQCSPRCRPGAFTLVELLVVLGLITSLVAILFPVLTTARVSSESIACASRVRDLYNYAVLYALDHGQHLPRPTMVGESANSRGSDYPEMCCWMQKAGVPAGEIDFESGGLWRYVSRGTRRAVVSCPGDRDEPAQYMGVLFPRNFSYSFNGNLRVDDARGRPVPMSQASVKRPAEKILIYEEIGPSDAWAVANLSRDDYPSARHGTSVARTSGRETIGPNYFYGGRGSYCFFDGHVESLSPSWILNPDNHKSWGPLHR